MAQAAAAAAGLLPPWLQVRPEGLYCAPGDFFIDPVRPVARAVITHGHADHARAGHGAVLATPETLDIMRARFGEAPAETMQALAYGEAHRSAGSSVRLRPGRPCAGLRPGRAPLAGPAHRRLRRLQAPARSDLRALRAGALRPLHHRGDLRPAGVPPPATTPTRSAGCSPRSAQFPDRSHLVGVYALGKASASSRCCARPAATRRSMSMARSTAVRPLSRGTASTLGPLARRRPAPRQAWPARSSSPALGLPTAGPGASPIRWPAFASGWMRVRAARPPARRRAAAGDLRPRRLGRADRTPSPTPARRSWITHGREEALVHRREPRPARPRRWRWSATRTRSRLSSLRCSASPSCSTACLTASRNAKLRLVRDYFLRQTPDPDRGWALAALTGDLRSPPPSRALIASRGGSAHRSAAVLAGPTTMSATWPRRWRWSGRRRPRRRPPSRRASPRSSTRLAATARGRGCRRLIEGWLDALDATGRWALLKLMTGGAARRRLRAARQDGAGRAGRRRRRRDRGALARPAPPYRDAVRLAGGPAAAPAAGERRGLPAADAGPRDRRGELREPRSGRLRRRMEMGRHPRAGRHGAGDRRAGSTRAPATTSPRRFPGHRRRARPSTASLDGELLVVRDGSGRSLRRPAAAAEPQDRRRQADSPASRPPSAPTTSWSTRREDLRPLPFAERRGAAGGLRPRAQRRARIDLSPLHPFAGLGRARGAARRRRAMPAIEGLMLKRWDSIYVAGRPKGPWFKWKRDPFMIDAVLMYAQRGHGKRSSLLFRLHLRRLARGRGRRRADPGRQGLFRLHRRGAAADRQLRPRPHHRALRPGPRGRSPALVFEVAFEGLQRSTRHKSGVAMRFPRISRIRWDKPPGEADTLANLRALIA